MQSQILFNTYLKGEHWKNRTAIYAEKFSEFLRKKEFNKLVLDIGCGNGRDVNAFQKQGFTVIGIDYSTRKISLAKENFPQCNFEVQNAENLDFPNESVGACFMINAIHYTNQKKVLNEIFRVLKVNGYAFIYFNIEIKDENDIDYHQDEKEILDLISNFKIIEKNVFTRTDAIPKIHTHKIMELILQKNHQ